jgi:YgiT-type zinc finger domain-containing protein
MGQSLEKEGNKMICHICGGRMEKIVTDLPFKVGLRSIIIVKEIPVLQCNNCREYLIEDAVMERVDGVLERVDSSAELEILSFAA